MRNFRDHLIFKGSKIKFALLRLNELAQDAILFVVDENNKLIGSLTDGDIRRGLLNEFTIDSLIDEIIQDDPRYIRKGENNIYKVIKYRSENYRILPVLDENNIVVNVINFRHISSYLPLDAVIMAGGKGQRLQPLTNTIPKPLLKVGLKPIMEHNLDRLAKFGIDDFWVTLNYLGEQIEEYFGNGINKNLNIKYIWETEFLGTIGAVSKISKFQHDYILVTNSDLLTNLDYEHFFLDFIENNADLSVVTIPYQVPIPYAVLETTTSRDVVSFKEKPTYTYYSNGGIYLIKKSMLEFIPQQSFYNATDLMEVLIANNKKVMSYPFSGYWLDIGKHEDFTKAQVDIGAINF